MPARGIGRQELEGEIIEDRPDALWSRALLEACRVAEAPALQRIVVAVDPPAGSGKRAAACGIVAAGITDGGICYVLADDTVPASTPNGWAMQGDRAVAPAARRRAGRRSQPGRRDGAHRDQRDRFLGAGDERCMPSRGKWLRAEPVAAFYEQGRVKHAGIFAALEDEMCDFGVSGLSRRQIAGPARRAGLGMSERGVPTRGTGRGYGRCEEAVSRARCSAPSSAA